MWLISVLENFSVFHLTFWVTGASDLKMDGLFLDGNNLLRYMEYLSSLSWNGALAFSLLLKLLSRTLEPWFVPRSFFIVKLFFIPINMLLWSCIKWCCHVWARAASCYLDILDKLNKGVCESGGPTFAAFPESLIHFRNVARLNWLNWINCIFFFIPGEDPSFL